MRALVQRVKGAAVKANGHETGRIERGFLVFVGFSKADNEESVQWMAAKIASLRVFEDSDGKMNLGLDAVGGDLLVVSQFTLYGDCNKGKRPSFVKSAPTDLAEVLYDRFVEILRETDIRVETGVFQAHMEVALLNDGPVTLWIEKEAE